MCPAPHSRPRKRRATAPIGLFRQITWLTRKNLQIELCLHPVSAPIRALRLPGALAVFLGYAPQCGGGAFAPVRSMLDVGECQRCNPRGRDGKTATATSSAARLTERSSHECTAPLKAASKDIAILSGESQMLSTCPPPKSVLQVSDCFAAAVFHSSTNTEEANGIWN
jgi:hypothetical protein